MKRTLTTALVAAVALTATHAAHAADHLDAPNVMGNGQIDINDLYAFQSPNNPDNSVLIMTVNPGAGAISGTTFGTDVSYEFAIDTNGDAVRDVTFATTFGAVTGGTQAYTVTRNGAAYAAGTTGVNTTNGTGQTTAGLFDDPFFFDLNGFSQDPSMINFTGDDFFAGLAVSAIVLEVPSADLGAQNVGIYARTVQGGSQVDRMGRPAITTALISPDDEKTNFNLSDPADDPANFGQIVRDQIATYGGDPNLADVLLPDLLTFDSSSADGFLTGRRLQDDVIDAELGLLTNGGLTSDGVDGNDVPFNSMFPYLAAVPEPTSAALLGLAGLALTTRRRRS